jgi:HSP20 family protein
MSSRNPHSWMWAEAFELLERAQRLQRQFFAFGHAVQSQPRWEPPVDIVAYDPDVQVSVKHGTLFVTALRSPPLNAQTTAVHRLEIPYGRFERQIALPAGRYELMEQSFVNGCLVLRLTKR